MNIKIEISEEQLKTLICQSMQEKLGDVKVNPGHIKIEVKSKQNYKSEWEKAAFRAVLEINE